MVDETEIPEGSVTVFSAHGVAPSVHANALVAVRRQDYLAAFEAISVALATLRRIGDESRLPPVLATMCGALPAVPMANE